MSGLHLVQRLGAAVLQALAASGRSAIFFWHVARLSFTVMGQGRWLWPQLYAVGTRSVVIVAASGLAVGFVLALQMYYALVTYGAADSLGYIVNLALVRELGPVVTALLFAGRAGTSLTAEIGLMKAGEQLSALEMMAVDPRRRVLAPRFLAGVISMPLLAALFSAVGILGAYTVAVGLIGVDAGNFWSIMQSKVDAWRDVGNGILKSLVFGIICTTVALYQGYETQATPEGVANATTRTVVVASLLVLLADFILTALLFTAQ